MRGAAVSLLLLLCVQWARAKGESGGVTGNVLTETEGEDRDTEVQFEVQGAKANHDQSSDQTSITTDIWAELKELRDMAIEQKVELRYSKSKIEKLEQENTDLLARVTASDNKNTVLETRMNSSENEVEELKRENAVLETRMNSSENELQELKRENADRPKVAFSVGLTDAGNVGPFNTQITLKFSKIFTNIGQAYNPTTGIFTAPVRGAYYFRFSLWDNRSSVSLGSNLYHNDKLMMWNSDYTDGVGYTYLSNGLALQLEKGDVVYMALQSGYCISDNSNNRTNFHGFLLFPL